MTLFFSLSHGVVKERFRNKFKSTQTSHFHLYACVFMTSGLQYVQLIKESNFF